VRNAPLLGVLPTSSKLKKIGKGYVLYITKHREVERKIIKSSSKKNKMKYLLVIFFFTIYKSSSGQINERYLVDTVLIRGALIESRFSKYIMNAKKQKRLYIDNPVYYVVFDSSMSKKDMTSRYLLNQYRVQNDSLKFLCNDKELTEFNNEILGNSLSHECNARPQEMFNKTPKKSKLKFRDDKMYQYKTRDCIFRCLKFKVPKSVLVEKDILTKYAFYNEFVYFFIVIEISNPDEIIPLPVL